MDRTRWRWSIVVCCVAASGAAFSALANGPAPVVDAAPRALPPGVWGGDVNDAPVAKPKHPPIREIPAMPMPNDIFPASLPSTDDSVIMYDAETGESRVLPAAIMSGATGGEGGTTYRGADGGPEDYGSRSFGTMSVQSNATRGTFPWRVNCKLVMRFVDNTGADRFFVCSGTMMDSEVALTAAHCVFNRDASINDWAQEIWVYPGFTDDSATDNQAESFGEARSTFYSAGSGYVNSGDWDRDNAAVRLTRAVGSLTGSFGWAWGFNCSDIQARTYHNAAYPSQGCGTAGLHNGVDMTYWFGQVDSCPDNQMQLDTTTGCYTAVWGGMSGSSMYYISGADRFAHGVCSTSNRSTVGKYCKMWEQFSIDLEAFKSVSRGSLFDLQALNTQLGATSVQENSTVSVNFLAVNPTNVDPGNQSYGFKVYLSSNSTISTADTVLFDGSFSWDFGTNDNVRVNVGNLQIPCGTTTGTKWIGVILDTGAGISPIDVDASNNDTQGWDAESFTVTANTAPAAPTNVNTLQLCGGVSVSWTGSTGATTYQIFRNTVNNSATATLLGSDPLSPYTDASTSPGVSYYYWVKASDGCDISGFSAVDGPISEAGSLSAPTNVAATAGTSCSSVSVSWTGVSGADTYNVYRNTTNTTVGATLLGSDPLSPYSDATAVPGLSYYYFVRADNECGLSAFSTGDSGYRNVVPSLPGSLTASTTVCGQVNLDWASVSFATSYDVRRNTVNNFATSTLIASPAVSNYSDTTANPGTSYFYWVVSSNLCGDSSPSAAVSGSALPNPGLPTGASASDGTSCANVSISWTAGAASPQFRVYRNTVNNSATATLLSTVNASPTTDATGVAGTTYFYYVAGYNGCVESARVSAGSGFRLSTPPVPSGLAATDGTSCSGVTITWNATAGATGYKVSRNTVNNSATAVLLGSPVANNFNDGTAIAGTNYFYFVRSSNTCGDSGFSAADVGYRGLGATIVTQPADLVVPVGSGANFSVVASGGPNSYTWFYNGLPLSNGGRVSGANTANLSISPVGLADDGAQITVSITNPCGSANSVRAKLTVTTCPCAADYDRSGGTPDVTDIDAFFSGWLAGDVDADADCSGGTPDVTDIDAFFKQWLAGGC
jgi:fibronectin type 3 domain-containing protein